MTSLTFRPAVAEDIHDVLAFWKRAAEDSHRGPDSTEAVARLIAHDSAALVLAFEGDAIVGSVIGAWDGWRCHVYRLAVDASCRRQGVARRLLRLVERRFAEAGGTRSDAIVLNDNEGGHGFWKAAGYVRQPQWSRWVKPVAPQITGGTVGPTTAAGGSA